MAWQKRSIVGALDDNIEHHVLIMDVSIVKASDDITVKIRRVSRRVQVGPEILARRCAVTNIRSSTTIPERISYHDGARIESLHKVRVCIPVVVLCA